MFLTFLRYIKQNQFLGSYKKKINYIYLNNLHRDEFIPWVVRAKGEGVKVVSIGRLPLSSDEAATTLILFLFLSLPIPTHLTSL